METEEQQIEAAKKWWKENGSSIITGLLLGLAALFGYRYWQDWQAGMADQASLVYAGMLNDAEQGDVRSADDKAGTLIADYSKTPYASLAALLLARHRVEEDNPDAAASQLQWVVDNGNNVYLRDIARLRLARVQLALEDGAAALATIGTTEAADNHGGLFEELRGDIHAANGEHALAAEAYAAALTGMSEEEPAARLIRLKLEDAKSAATMASVETAE